MKLDEKIRKHLGQCAPHQRERHGYVLLQEALVEIERLQLECESCGTQINIVEEAVNKFLSWKLPENFNPDCGINFTKHSALGNHRFSPIGTNLFTADQAKEMIEFILTKD